MGSGASGSCRRSSVFAGLCLAAAVIGGGRASGQDCSQGGFPGEGARLTVPYPLALDAADIDGDGRVDLLASGPVPAIVRVFFGKDDGTFRSEDVPASAGPGDILAADWNRDGIPDIATAAAETDSVSLFPGKDVATARFRSRACFPPDSKPPPW